MTVPKLVPQPHGGALLSGGVPGNRGGTGRPPSAVREIAREAYADRIPRLTAIIDDPESKPSEVVAAMALLERTGLGLRHEVTAIEAPEPLDLDALRAEIMNRLPRVDDEDDEPRALPGAAAEG
jgi:hypothetical protein